MRVLILPLGSIYIGTMGSYTLVIHSLIYILNTRYALGMGKVMRICTYSLQLVVIAWGLGMARECPPTLFPPKKIHFLGIFDMLKL